MSQEKPGQDPRERSDEKTFKQSDTPWKQPVEKGQTPREGSKPDLEKWGETDTH